MLGQFLDDFDNAIASQQDGVVMFVTLLVPITASGE
jgi:hypothetical protein